MTVTPDWAAISVFSGPEQSPGFVLWRDFMRWQRQLNTALRPLNLTQPQFAILAVCGWMTRAGDAVTQGDLVDYLQLDRMHVSQIATTLEQKGLLERVVCPSDTRAKQVWLTPQGADLLVEAVRIVEDFDARFFAQRLDAAPANAGQGG